MKKFFKVVYLLDIVSIIQSEYTKYFKVEAKNEVDALKKFALSQTREDALANIEYINSLQGTVEEVIEGLGGMVHGVMEITEEEFNAIEDESVIGCSNQGKKCESRLPDGNCDAPDSCKWQIL